MKVTGIVCEYNPFHSGHKYMIDEIKTRYNSDYIIAIMSGNYVQRGLPAYMDKYTRANMALSMGVDLVIELPVVYATSSSEIFAEASIAILDKCGIVTDLVFGSECNDINILKLFASILSAEPDNYKKILKEKLKTGITYAAAKYDALIKYIDGSDSATLANLTNLSEKNIEETLSNYTLDQLREIVASPNNNLGIEYLKSLFKLNSNINAHTLKRINSNYHDTDVGSASYSATALRNALDTGNFDAIDNEYMREIYKESFNKSFPISADDFSTLLGSSLVKTNLDKDADFIDYYGITEALSNKISNSLYSYKTFSSYTDMLKTKEIAHSAIYRGLLHILLDIKATQAADYMAKGYTDYVRILGFTKKGSALIGKLQENLTTIINPKKDELTLSTTFKNMYITNLYADDLYRMVQMNKFGTDLPNEYTRKL